jgi:hypothetical protein
VIESGKTTGVQIPVIIDTSGRDITRFAITSPVYAEGGIDQDANAIRVHVETGTDLSAMEFTVTHTGVSVSINPGSANGPLDFNYSQTFTVTAENGDTNTWTVTVIDDIEPPPLPNTRTWPGDSILGRYGLSGLSQPAGTTVSMTADVSGTLMVQLANADVAAYSGLVTRLEAITGGTGTDSSMPDMGIS